ncbi:MULTISPECIES: L-dopachrome tautomerase-related protein [Pseudoalteromonas]|uniref:L-dopachrome tautomerase-related protein n=1 Tax=Pseudoalteromonas TaxID=53246 RepID=UPI00051A29FC|nr:L-dopachrome tautomerase-related protein [Pseudoalteromonas sp. ND6B]KGK02071.1 major royal jelly protein [Pseudoalteromonas sp. ND6B]
MTHLKKRLIAITYSITLLVSNGALANNSELTTVATFDAQHPPGNIAITPSGRKFLSIHGFYGQNQKIMELLSDGTTKPYPNEQWAYAYNKSKGFYGVLGVNVSSDGILWMLDTSGPDHAGRLVGWDTNQEQLHKIIYLAKPTITDTSFLNDLVIDNKHGVIYIADTAQGTQAAIIIVSLKTGEARRVLQDSQYTTAENIDMVINGRTMRLGGQPARLGVNPITLDPNEDWLYFGSMSGTSVYRIATSAINNEQLSAKALEAKVMRYGTKPISDGITVDGGGNVYVTDITNGAIGVVKPNGDYEVLFKDDRLSWPDGFSYGADHKIYFTVNDLHNSLVLSNDKTQNPNKFKVMSFTPLVKGKVGR